MFATQETTGVAISGIVKDVCLRFNFPLARLRGQTYDDASNTAGAYSGCQIIIDECPNAIYVHCGAHCVNLVTESVMTGSPLIRDSFQRVKDFGVLTSHSGKFKNMSMKIIQNNSAKNNSAELQNVKLLRPLCPTRWVVKAQGIRTVIQHYSSVLESLDEFAQGAASTVQGKATASGLLDRFSNSNTMLALQMALEVFEVLEYLCTALQGQKQTVSGMLQAVAHKEGADRSS